MKRTKVAAVIAGSGMALGVASPAFADHVEKAAPQPQQQEKQLLNSATKPVQDVQNPLGDGLDVKAIIGSVDKVADKLKVEKVTKAGTAVGDTAKAVSPASMLGGLPAGVPLG